MTENEKLNAMVWLRLNAFRTYINRHLATQAKCAATIRRRGPRYDYLTYLHKPNIKLLRDLLERAMSYKLQLKRNGKGKVSPQAAFNMLRSIREGYDKIDLDTDYRYAYQHGLNRARLMKDLVRPEWERAGVDRTDYSTRKRAPRK